MDFYVCVLERDGAGRRRRPKARASLEASAVDPNGEGMAEPAERRDEKLKVFVSYARDDGTLTWTGGWIERDDDGSPAGGNVFVNAGGEVSRVEIANSSGDLEVVTVGRKGTAAMRRGQVPLAASFDGFGDKPTFADILPLARLISDDFLAGTYAKVHLLYPAFVSTLVQRPEMKRLLPVRPQQLR